MVSSWPGKAGPVRANKSEILQPFSSPTCVYISVQRIVIKFFVLFCIRVASFVKCSLYFFQKEFFVRSMMFLINVFQHVIDQFEYMQIVHIQTTLIVMFNTNCVQFSVAKYIKSTDWSEK